MKGPHRARLKHGAAFVPYGKSLTLCLSIGLSKSLPEQSVTYASIGYGDVLVAKPWRVLGAIEGATGVIVLGWSTAFLVSILSQLKLFGHDWLAPQP